jgi:hypothetical protein
MFRSVRAVPHIEIERESDPARVSLFTVNSLGTLLLYPPIAVVMLQRRERPLRSMSRRLLDHLIGKRE